MKPTTLIPEGGSSLMFWAIFVPEVALCLAFLMVTAR